MFLEYLTNSYIYFFFQRDGLDLGIDLTGIAEETDQKVDHLAIANLEKSLQVVVISIRKANVRSVIEVRKVTVRSKKKLKKNHKNHKLTSS